MTHVLKKRKKTRLANFNYTDSGHIYFITLCTAGKNPYFKNDRIATVIIDELEHRRSMQEIRLLCCCVMPDHLHVLLSLTENYHKSLQNWISSFKRFTTKVIKEQFGITALWQKNFYEHVVRKEESLLKVAEYILNNPVRKGIVSQWNEYPHNKLSNSFPL